MISNEFKMNYSTHEAVAAEVTVGEIGTQEKKIEKEDTKNSNRNITPQTANLQVEIGSFSKKKDSKQGKNNNDLAKIMSPQLKDIRDKN